MTDVSLFGDTLAFGIPNFSADGDQGAVFLYDLISGEEITRIIVDAPEITERQTRFGSAFNILDQCSTDENRFHHGYDRLLKYSNGCIESFRTSFKYDVQFFPI